MKKAFLISVCCASLLCSACAKSETDPIPRHPWPTHAPEATPYISRPEASETPPEPVGEVYDSWEEFLVSVYVRENNFWFLDWELEMFKALPQDEPYYFNIDLATAIGFDNEATLKVAETFALLGTDAEVWASSSIYDGVEETYYICFIKCTPKELWELSSKVEGYYFIEQKYPGVAERFNIPIWHSEGSAAHD